jgi:hypothetical protein
MEIKAIIASIPAWRDGPRNETKYGYFEFKRLLIYMKMYESIKIPLIF